MIYPGDKQQKNLQADPQVGERRRFERRVIKLVISFCTPTKEGTSQWHFGWIQDAGMGGVKIRSGSPLFWDCGRRVTVLCLPADGNRNPAGGQEPVVRIEGAIVWMSGDGHCFGLQYQ